MQVIGLDLSLSSTGVANAAGRQIIIVKPGKRRGYERLRHITAEILWWCADADVVCVEGPSFQSRSSSEKGHHERAGLWWFVTAHLDEAGIEVKVITPSSLKKYATGKGNASKDQVLLAAARRFEWFDGTNDQADALWLSAMGYDLAGQSVVEMPQTHRAALAPLQAVA